LERWYGLLGTRSLTVAALILFGEVLP
jgi:hypothetical protein